ncbi:MAG: VWA domain-containing protein [Nitrospirae bacterium]|nr:VWA domain-containing protein [Nitrospirota bacterium]
METHIKEARGRIDGISKRVGDAFEEAAKQAAASLPEDAWPLWVEIGAVMAETSSTPAIRYFRESPEILWSIGRSSEIQSALRIVLDATHRDYGVALEVFRQYPKVLPSINPDVIRSWVRIGLEFAEEDYTAAIEYIKAGPEILPLLPPSEIERWARIGFRIFEEDRETKGLRALEYFRLTPKYLARIRDETSRSRLMELAEQIGTTSTSLSLEILEQAPVSLDPLETAESREMALYASLILAKQFPSVVAPYLRSIPEVFRLSGGDLSKFEEWTRKGLEFTQQEVARGKAFFSLELKGSREVLEKISGAVFLKDISRVLAFYAEALCGRSVEIRAVPATGERPPSFGGVLFLPEQVRLFPRPEDNLRFYRVMTLHEAGHLEFGTYDPVPEELVNVLSHLPDPVLANILWTIAEEGRIDFLVRSEYPGIRADMDAVITLQMGDRPDLFQMPPHQGVLEALMRLSVTEDVNVPLPLLDVVSGAYDILKNVMRRGATVADSLKTTAALFQYLDDPLGDIRWESDSKEPPEKKSPPPPSPYHPPAPFSYRTPLPRPEVLILQESPPPEGEPECPKTPPGRTVEARTSQGKDKEEHVPAPSIQPKGISSGPSSGLFFYDEWDTLIGDYRRHWCRLCEKGVEGTGSVSNRGDELFGGGPAERKAERRYVEALRPEGFRKIKYREDGEDLDLDAAVAAVAEKRGSGRLTHRIYFQREKKTRDVAAAFLIDMSGSTRRMVHWEKPGETSRRVIDIEKEGLLLLSESLQAVGDEYALYGFSGQSKDRVDFFVIKRFEEAYGPLIRNRILAMEPGGQNRDGAAIRHAVRKLLSRGSRTKLLILISDGRPLDQDYSGEYSLEDTRMALREAKAFGIRPFCMTIDHEADEYVHTMYRDVPFLILDDLRTLPQKLPRIYKRLTF